MNIKLDSDNRDNRNPVEAVNPDDRPWYAAYKLFDKCATVRTTRIGHRRSAKQRADYHIPAPFEF